jgi:hypothetical protein
MTKREKVLSLCMGATLGGVGLWMVVNWAVVQPFRNVEQAIRDERAYGDRLHAKLRELRDVERDWQRLTARTFSDDPKVAQRRFREDIHQLLEMHELGEPKVSPGTFILRKDGAIEVPLNISAAGTLNEIVGFLCGFYRRDYLARLDKVRITAEQSIIGDANSARRAGRSGARRAGRGAASPAAAETASAAGGPHGPELKVNISAVTLVLPAVPGVEPTPLEKVDVLDSGRLLRPVDEYSEITAKNMFSPHRPRPVEVAKKSDEEPPDVPVTPTPGPVRPTVDPRIGADQRFVRTTTRLNGAPVAYVYDDSQPTQPPTPHRLDEPIDDGTLLLIHPKGIVVRVDEGGTETDYFYPLGTSFKDRVELTPDNLPDIWQALENEFVHS